MKKFLFILFLFPCLLFGQNVDSLKFVLKTATNDSVRCYILNELIENEWDDNIWPLYNEQLKVIAEKNIAGAKTRKKLYFKYLAAALNNFGFLAEKKGDYSEAIKFYKSSLKTRNDIGDKFGIAESMGNLGFLLFNQGDILTALDYFHQSLKIQEEIGDKKGMAKTFNNLGLVYDQQKDPVKALEYYQKSLKIKEEINDRYGINSCLNNIASAYFSMKDTLTALDYLKRCYAVQKELNDKAGMAFSLNNIGIIYFDKGDLKTAKEFYEKSLKIREELGDKDGVVNSLNSIAIVLIKSGKINEAFLLANKGLVMAKETGFIENIAKSAVTLKSVYRLQNKYKEAFEMYELEIKMRDSINNQETQKASIKKQMQYTYEKKELEAKNEQEKKDLITMEELIQKEHERNYFIVGFGLVIILALFIFRGYKQKQKANEVITEQKKLVDEKQKEILDSIHYAKRIQTALITSEKYINKSLDKLIQN